MTPVSDKYTMRISRLTIDKLGIQMYDRVSAVLAELIANSYDADAETVEIALPFGEWLARKTAKVVQDQGFEIIIQDNGHGMTENEINEYYLNVGYNRRKSRSEVTPKHHRRVMGRKGIGKLAPFGICHEVEVMSAGGKKTDRGYLISNLILKLEDMLEERRNERGEIEPYHPQPGTLDGTYADKTGTKLILKRFNRRRVPTKEDLNRQLAGRFGLSRQDWSVLLVDSKDADNRVQLGALDIDFMEGTRIDVTDRPVLSADGKRLSVTGWVAYARDPYKDEVMAGVRLYARGKIVAQTRDFDIKTGFTGEFKMRSYLTGEIHAEWLDQDEDIVRTDRQDIIWNSELGIALRNWGQELLRELAAKAESNARRRVWDVFLENSRLQERLERAFPRDAPLRDSVLRAARALVTRSDRDSVEDTKFLDRVVGLAFAVGPHRTLLETLDEIAAKTDEPVGAILDLFEKARVVEMYSLGQVAKERVEAVEQLRRLVSARSTVEDQLQRLIESAPWILYPDWTPLSFNQSLARTRESFESWYQAKYNKEVVTSAIDNPGKRPDFVMLNHEGRLELVEIKRPQHALTDNEFNRAFAYLDAVAKFITDSTEVRNLFSEARLTIVCDNLGLSSPLASLIETNTAITRKIWHDLLQATSRSHEDFLAVVKRLQGELPQLPKDED